MSEDFTEQTGFLDFLAQIVALHFQFVAKHINLLKSTRVCDCDCGGVGEDTEPLQTGTIELAPAKRGQHAENLSSKQDRVARECHELLASHPIRVADPLL